MKQPALLGPQTPRNRIPQLPLLLLLIRANAVGVQHPRRTLQYLSQLFVGRLAHPLEGTQEIARRSIASTQPVAALHHFNNQRMGRAPTRLITQSQLSKTQQLGVTQGANEFFRIGRDKTQPLAIGLLQVNAERLQAW